MARDVWAGKGQSDDLVIGVGTSAYGDDAVGLVVAAELRARAVPGVRVLTRSGDGLTLMEAWDGFKRVVLIDAVRSGQKAGTLHRIDLRTEVLLTGFFRASTHGFDVAEAIELARVMNRLPPRMILFGVEGKTFSPGKGLSDEVQGAVPQAVNRIVGDLGCDRGRRLR